MATINLKVPLRRSSAGAFAANEDTLDAVRDDLKVLLLTNYGERPIHYDFGANLRSAIFEFQGAELRQVVEDLIRAAVEKWMPFVNLLSVVIEDETTTPGLVSNSIQVNLEFTVGNLDIKKTLKQRIKA